jgi:hypothetical protein
MNHLHLTSYSIICSFLILLLLIGRQRAWLSYKIEQFVWVLVIIVLCSFAFMAIKYQETIAPLLIAALIPLLMSAPKRRRE